MQLFSSKVLMALTSFPVVLLLPWNHYYVVRMTSTSINNEDDMHDVSSYLVPVVSVGYAHCYSSVVK